MLENNFIESELSVSLYNHFISLGSFCSLASELERFGLRDASYPFDWLISDFKDVIYLIDNEFDDLFNEKYFMQNTTHRECYVNEARNMYFFQDFNAYEPL